MSTYSRIDFLRDGRSVQAAREDRQRRYAVAPPLRITTDVDTSGVAILAVAGRLCADTADGLTARA